MSELFKNFILGKKRISIIQAENPDGDSLGAAIALYHLLDTEVSLYCPVDIPKYLRYYPDWSIVTNQFDFNADGYIIVDTAAKALLSKLLDTPEITSRLYHSPVLVIDHHETMDDLDFPHQSIIQPLPACCQLIYNLAEENQLKINRSAAEALLSGLLADTLGLTSASTTAEAYRVAAKLIDHGAVVNLIEEQRREFMKKTPRILDYKADLIKKIQYYLEGQLAIIHIPWEEIKTYSDEYNPNVLILEELRLVEGVKVGIAIKTYPDGKLTAKLRTTLPIAEQIAGYFGGGGHPYAAGFKIYGQSISDVVPELVQLIGNLLQND